MQKDPAFAENVVSYVPPVSMLSGAHRLSNKIHVVALLAKGAVHCAMSKLSGTLLNS